MKQQHIHIIVVFCLIALLIYIVTYVDKSKHKYKELLSSQSAIDVPIETDIANIDAVTYETILVEKTDNTTIAHVIANGTSNEVTQFSLEYESFVKYLNEDLKEIVVYVYNTNADYEANKPNWIFSEGTLIEQK